MSFQLKHLRATENGVRSALHELESAVMEVIWRRFTGEFTVRDVLAALRHERDLAYTTVMTTVDRLAKKGLLTREMVGKAYSYRVAVGREAFMSSVVEQLVGALAPDQRHSALAYLVERAGEADPGELDHLQALIDARRKALGRP